MPVQYPFNPEQQGEYEGIQRKRRIADALLGSGMNAAPGQMVGPYFMQTAGSNILQGVAGALLGKQQAGKEQELIKGASSAQSADLQRIANAIKGRQAQPGGLVEDASGNVTQQNPIAAQTPQQGLADVLPGLTSPLGQQFAQKFLEGQMTPSAPYTLKPGERRFGPDNKIIGEGAAEKPGGPDGGYTLSPGAKRIGPNGEVIADNPRSQSSTPFFSPQQTPNGIFAFDARTGTMKQITGPDGKPIVGAQNDPALQRSLAAAKAGGAEAGKEQAVAQLDLPRIVANAQNNLQLIDQMIGSEDGKTKAHPGFQTSVGIGTGAVSKLVPGSNAANFHALLDQVKGGAFLEAFNSLKGGGQITEIEGKKATDAITRMRTTQSEAEFVKAAREYQSIIRKGVERAQQKAGATPGTNDRRSNPRATSTTVVDY